MSQSYSPPPEAPGQPHPHQQPAPAKGSGFAVTALVLGIIAVVFSLIPIVNIVAIILGIIGLIFGVIGIFRSRRVMSIIGSALCLLAIILSVAISGAFASAVDDELNGNSDGSGDPMHIVYTLESDAPTVSATYATLDGGNIGSSQENGVPLPWTKELDVDDSLFNSFTLTGIMDPVLDGSTANGSTITCRITVDGEVVAEQTSSGQFAAVTCSAS